MDTVGQKLAERSVALRKRFGRYPIRIYEFGMANSILTWPEFDPVTEPVDDSVQIPECPDYTKMEPAQLNWLPLNRADWRARLRPLLPRKSRLDTFSRRLHDPRQWVYDDAEISD